MFEEQLGIQSAQECHFKGQTHVNLSEHDYRFFNVYILLVLLFVWHVGWRHASKHNRWLRDYGAFLWRQDHTGSLETENENIGRGMKTFWRHLICTYQLAQHIHRSLYSSHVFVYKFGKRTVCFSEFVSWILRAEPKPVHYGNE